jgi:peroxiredoxin
MNARRIGMALAGVGALLLVALTVRSTTGVAPAPNERADLSATLKDLNGADVSLSRYAGQPLVINLWATWCGPCRLETPQLVDLYTTFKDRGLVVIGISTDDTPDKVRAFADEYKVPYPMLLARDQPDVLRALGYNELLPMTLFVRRDGTIAERSVGIATTATMERRILALLE